MYMIVLNYMTVSYWTHPVTSMKCFSAGLYWARGKLIKLAFAEVVNNLDQCCRSSQDESSHSEQNDQNVFDEFPAEATERLVRAARADYDVDDRRKDECKCAARERSDQRDHEVELRNDGGQKNWKEYGV